MDIRSPSLYAAFGSKENLYVEAVEHYTTTVQPLLWSCLDSSTTDRECMKNILLTAAKALRKSAKKTRRRWLRGLGASTDLASSGVFPAPASNRPSQLEDCLAGSASRHSMHFGAERRCSFAQRRARRNPKAVSAAAEALEGPPMV